MAGWLRRQKFRVRLGALVAAAVGLTITLAASATYLFVHHQLYNQVDSSLAGEVLALTNSQGVLRPGQQENFFRLYNNSLLQVIDETGTPQPFFNSPLEPNPPVLPVNRSDIALATAGSGAGPVYRNIKFQNHSYRLLTVGANNELNGTTAAIQIAVPLTDVAHSLSDLRLILWLVTLGGIGVGVALGYIIGRDTIRPVERLTAAAEHVAATQDLDSTIDDRGEDELARLARAFNSMLRALAASRQQQAQLLSDAGHELRTPLTSLRTNIEVLLRVKDLPEADRADLLADVHAQLEEMTTLVGDVVELAREDEAHTEPIEVRFDPIVERAVERVRRRAPTVVFDVQLMPGSIRAHPAVLERAVLNVLDNAAKWSPEGGTIRVRLERGESWLLEVRDEGPGIAANDLPHVFDRFYRAETARSLPGSGLGLAIVQQAIAAHGGTVTAASPPGGGTLIRIELPTVPENEPEAESALAEREATGTPGGEPQTESELAWGTTIPPIGEADLQPYLPDIAGDRPTDTHLAPPLQPHPDLTEPNPYGDPASWAPDRSSPEGRADHDRSRRPDPGGRANGGPEPTEAAPTSPSRQRG
jgi:two-component system sensor histidine kinase MprB